MSYITPSITSTGPASAVGMASLTSHKAPQTDAVDPRALRILTADNTPKDLSDLAPQHWPDAPTSEQVRVWTNPQIYALLNGPQPEEFTNPNGTLNAQAYIDALNAHENSVIREQIQQEYTAAQRDSQRHCAHNCAIWLTLKALCSLPTITAFSGIGYAIAVHPLVDDSLLNALAYAGIIIPVGCISLYIGSEMRHVAKNCLPSETPPGPKIPWAEHYSAIRESRLLLATQKLAAIQTQLNVKFPADISLVVIAYIIGDQEPCLPCHATVPLAAGETNEECRGSVSIHTSDTDDSTP